MGKINKINEGDQNIKRKNKALNLKQLKNIEEKQHSPN